MNDNTFNKNNIHYYIIIDVTKTIQDDKNNVSDTVEMLDDITEEEHGYIFFISHFVPYKKDLFD